MRQHVNPLNKNFLEIEPLPPLSEIFENPKLPLHLDIGCASGDFLFELASKNENWNYSYLCACQYRFDQSESKPKKPFGCWARGTRFLTNIRKQREYFIKRIPWPICGYLLFPQS